MGLALALIVMGILLFLDRAGTDYGLKQGWPWVVVALGFGGIVRNRRSLPAWITTIVGLMILGGKYYAIKLSVPGMVRTYFLPVLLIAVGLLWLLKYRRD
jgi:hypothetical protein